MNIKINSQQNQHGSITAFEAGLRNETPVRGLQSKCRLHNYRKPTTQKMHKGLSHYLNLMNAFFEARKIEQGKEVIK